MSSRPREGTIVWTKESGTGADVLTVTATPKNPSRSQERGGFFLKLFEVK